MALYVNLVVFFMIIPTCHCVGLRSLATKRKNTKGLSFLPRSPSKERSLLDKICGLLKKLGNHGGLQRMLPFSSLLLCTGTNNHQRLSGQQLRLIIHSGHKQHHACGRDENAQGSLFCKTVMAWILTFTRVMFLKPSLRLDDAMFSVIESRTQIKELVCKALPSVHE